MKLRERVYLRPWLHFESGGAEAMSFLVPPRRSYAQGQMLAVVPSGLYRQLVTRRQWLSAQVDLGYRSMIWDAVVP